MTMIFNFEENGRLKNDGADYRGGSVTFGTWATVARDLAAIGWGTLNPDEYCQQLKVDQEGITMVIAQRTQAK